MKTIGLLGGLSWESSLMYYRAINRGVNEKLGGFHSAEIVMVSVDFAPIEKMQQAGDWQACAGILIDAARKLESSGADFFLMCTNTMHIVADELAQAVTLPFHHIVDATGEALKERGITTVGLLGTEFTMEKAFYKRRLEEVFDIQVVTPVKEDRAFVHQVIYRELCQGILNPQSRAGYLDIVERLCKQGAQAVILGCTEIGMLISQNDTSVELFDSTVIHSNKAVELALEI